jgi:hypothetical protein
MMKLFNLRTDLSICCTFLPLEGTPDVWDGLFDGTPRLGGYPIRQGERGEERADGPLPDFTTFDLAYPTFSSRAREILDELLTPYGEFAAIELDEPMRYFAFNATTIVDVLDEQKSKIKRYTDGGVMRVEQHILRESVTTLPPIFKIPQTRRNTTYVNEAFVQRVQTSGLQGFRFELLFAR